MDCIYFRNQAQRGFFVVVVSGVFYIHNLHVCLFMHVCQFLLVRKKLSASGFDYVTVRGVCWYLLELSTTISHRTDSVNVFLAS